MYTLLDNQSLTDQWYAFATELEVANGPIGRTVLGVDMVAYQDPSGEVVVVPDRCPHREAPLSCGTFDRGILRCCYHGWAFGEEGKCVEIPSADPDFPIPQMAHLKPYQSRVRYGLIWVCLVDEPQGEIPQIDEDGAEGFRRINNPVQHWDASATRMTDNFLDIAHFPWVHTGTFGNAQRTNVPDFEIKTLPGNYTGYDYDVIAENPGGANLTSGQESEVVSRHMSTGFHLPFSVRSTILYENGIRHILLLLPTPIDDTHSYFTFVVWRSDDFSIASEDVVTFDRSIGNEDKVMLEKLSGLLPLESKALANTRSDKASARWRQDFRKLIEAA